MTKLIEVVDSLITRLYLKIQMIYMADASGARFHVYRSDVRALESMGFCRVR